MHKQSLTQSVIHVSLVFLLASCGAASNRDRADSTRDGDGRNIQPITLDQNFKKFSRSQVFRDQGSQVFSYAQIQNFLSPTNSQPLPSTVYLVPEKNRHDLDDRALRPSANVIDCGISVTDPTIEKRKQDCRAKNQTSAYGWSGQANSISGEGDWQLVAHKNGRSVWQDLSTGLIWSSPIPANTWDKASGAEVPESLQICNGANNTDSDYFLGITAEEVTWRLPTRNDFLQADINGSRFVLSTDPNGDNQIYWTANFSSDTQSVWVIQHNTGILSRSEAGSQKLPIRCVGVVIK